MLIDLRTFHTYDYQMSLYPGRLCEIDLSCSQRPVLYYIISRQDIDPSIVSKQPKTTLIGLLMFVKPKDIFLINYLDLLNVKDIKILI